MLAEVHETYMLDSKSVVDDTCLLEVAADSFRST